MYLYLVGTPYKSFDVIFDTGIFARYKEKNYSIDQQHFLIIKNHLVIRNIDKHWNITFGQGQIKGYLSKDRILLNNLSSINNIFAEGTHFTKHFYYDQPQYDNKKKKKRY